MIEISKFLKEISHSLVIDTAMFNMQVPSLFFCHLVLGFCPRLKVFSLWIRHLWLVAFGLNQNPKFPDLKNPTKNTDNHIIFVVLNFSFSTVLDDYALRGLGRIHNKIICLYKKILYGSRKMKQEQLTFI